MIELKLRIVHKTDKAFLLTDDYNAEAWIGMAMNGFDWEEPDEIGDTTTFYLPEWWAEKNGFV